MKPLFPRNPFESAARTLYEGIVEQARQPAFYQGCGLPDTLDGRFDLLVLHVFLVMHRLKQDRHRTAELSQALFDVLFQDMDESLRKLGAGDVGIGGRVKAMAEGFYGRVAAYDQALAQPGRALEEAVRRNLFGTVEPEPAHITALANYIRCEAGTLSRQDTDALMKGRVAFGPAPRPQA